MASSVVSCRWDWCRSTFPSIDALDIHVKHDHIWPMKPMRKAEIALMRSMDLQSLHSSLDTDSSIIPTGLLAGVSRSETPPWAVSPASDPEKDKRRADEEFDTFTQLSSQAYSAHKLLSPPAFESLMKQDEHSGLSAPVEMLGRNHGHKCLRASSRLSQSSDSSQEVVEQQLTQEEDVASRSRLPSQTLNNNNLTDVELVWPTDEELAIKEIKGSEQPASEQNSPLDSFIDSTRGQNFHCGSLDVPLSIHSLSAVPGADSQASHASSQPLVLQTQAPYSSQVIGWGQSQ